jgi:response regulator of citrate/malate metabolism
LSDPVHYEQVRRSARLDAEQWSWAAATCQLEGFYRAVLSREQELPRRIAEQSTAGTSTDEICDALQISKATLRRQMRLMEDGHARNCPNYAA